MRPDVGTLPVAAERKARALRVGAGAAALFALALAAAGLNPLLIVAPVAVLVLVGAVSRRIVRWDVLIGFLLLVILLMPIRRYTLGSSLPFEMEPYRVLVVVLALFGIASLLAEPRVRLRRSGLEAPIALLLVAVVASVVANADDIARSGVEPVVIKKLTFFVSFLIVAYLVATVVRTRRQVETAIKVLVLGGTFLALLTIFESWTGNNLFNKLSAVPGLDFNPAAATPEGVPGRGGRARVFASAQHPIALGAALALLMPLALHLAFREERRIWWLSAALLSCGALATVSRTPFVMLVVIALVLAWLRPTDVRRLAPVAVAFALFINVVIPGAIGGIKNQFFPEGGLIAQQQGREGESGSGRIADLGPSLSQWSLSPLTGQGYGSRVVEETEGVPANAVILDNQWLGLLLEVGALGVLAIAWLFVRAVRRLGALARTEPGPDGWLFAALAASLSAFATGMFTYDAFAFVQVTVLMFVLLGLTMSVATPERVEPARQELRDRLRARRLAWQVARHGQLPPASASGTR